MDKSYIKIFSVVKLVGVGDVKMTLRCWELPTSCMKVALPVVVHGQILHQIFHRGQISGGR